MKTLWLNDEKLRRWVDNAFREIMRVVVGRTCGVWYLSASELLLFSIEFRIMMFSFKCHWKVKIVFLLYKNIRTDNFNLAKSLRNTWKVFIFLLTSKLLQSYFSKYSPLYFKDIAYSISKILSSFNNTYVKEYLFLAVCP